MNPQVNSLKNYLKNERIHYSVRLKDGENKSIQLFEHIEGFSRDTSYKVGVVFSWRADIIQKFLNHLIQECRVDPKVRIIPDKKSKHSESQLSKTVEQINWNLEYKLNTEISMKLLLAMKLVSSIEQRPRIESSLEIINSLSDEEISFWVWKVLSLHNRALNGFKSMYL